MADTAPNPPPAPRVTVDVDDANTLAQGIDALRTWYDYRTDDPRSDCELKMTKWSKLTKAGDADVIVPYVD